MKNIKMLLMKSFFISLLTSCQALPAIFGEIKEIETQEAIKVIVDKNLVTEDKDLNVFIILKNPGESG